MISCHSHDTIEIACLYRIKIKLVLESDTEVIGIGETTHYNSIKEECLIMQTETGSLDIVLTQIKTMTALEVNPHFKTVSFNQQLERNHE